MTAAQGKEGRPPQELSLARQVELVTSGPDWIWLIDLEGCFVWSSPQVEALLGYRPDELIGRSPFSLHPETEQAKARKAFEELLQSPPPYHLPLIRLLHRDGHEVFFEVHIQLSQDDEGRLSGYSGVTRDITERIRLERARTRSEERYRLALDNMPGTAVLLFDREMRYLMVNGSLAEQTGLHRDRLIGRRVQDVFPEGELRDAVEEIYGAALRGEEFRRETRFFGRIFDNHALPLPGPGGDLLGGMVIVRDITEQSQAFEEIRRSEEQLRTALEATSDGFWLWNIEDGVRERGARWFEVFGYADEGLIENDSAWWAQVHPDDQLRLRELEQHLLESPNERFEVEFRFRKESGEWAWVRARGQVLAVDEKGRATRIVGTDTDITRQVQTLEALRESEQLHRQLIDASPDAITYSNQDGIIEAVSPSLLRIFGVEGDEQVVGTPLRSWLHPDDHERGDRRVGEILRGQQDNQRQIYRMLRADGQNFYGEVLSSTVYNANGEPRGILSILRDITPEIEAEQERERFEEQLRHAQKLESLGVLAGGIAHDFNNLLTGILGNASLLEDELPGSAAQMLPLVREVTRSAERAAELTQQLLAYSGKGQLIIGEVELGELLQELRALLRSSIDPSTELEIDLAPNLPAINGDASQLRQVMMNLILNASEALEGKRGSVQVSLCEAKLSAAELEGMISFEETRPGHFVELRVVDDGVGMDEEVRRSIFDPFFTTKFTGRGLGLAALQGIVRGHGGAVQIQSKPGHGTCFLVYLPVSTASRAPADSADVELSEPGPKPTVNERQEQSLRPLDGKRILIADDEEMVLNLADRILRSQGAQTLLAHNGNEALELFEQHREQLDAAVLDVTMPGMGGVEAAQRMREQRPGLPIGLASGYTRAETLGEQSDLLFLRKPFGASSFVGMIRTMLEI